MYIIDTRPFKELVFNPKYVNLFSSFQFLTFISKFAFGFTNDLQRENLKPNTFHNNLINDNDYDNAHHFLH